MDSLGFIVANKLLAINSIILQPYSPFLWGNGWNAPIYTDNRVMLSYPQVRNFVKVELSRLVMEHFPEVESLASVAMGAIAQGALVADTLGVPFVYVRDMPKDHGLENIIEGNIAPGQKVVLIEDQVSTGRNALRAAQAVSDAGGDVLGMVAIFSYEFPEAIKNFKKAGLKLLTLTNYNSMLDAALKTGYIKENDLDTLQQWRRSPEDWTPSVPEID